MNLLDPQQVLRRGRAPAGLWLRGRLPPTDRVRVGLIGSRAATPQQLDVTQLLADTLARGGACVVSGGARGVDAQALTTAIMAGVPTMAVLPSGLDQPYPPEHGALFTQIAQGGGALLSGFEPGTRATPARFLARNTLMTQTIDVLITVCAGVHSGSLNCAATAWQEGLPVFAVPWTPGSPNSEGSNRLLQAGARAVWDESGCRQLLAALQDHQSARLLARDVAAPGRRERGGQARAQGHPDDAPVLTWSIDAGREGQPSYRPEAVTSQAAVNVPADCDPDLVRGLTDALRDAGPAGLSLEELAQALACPRSLAARTALQLVLHGAIRRSPGGGFHL